MIESLRKRYYAALHTIQTVVAYTISKVGDNGAGADAKHLRVGVDSAMINDHALATLLIEKGVFTQEEYDAQVLKSAEQEVVKRVKETRERFRLPDSVRFS